MAKDIRAWAFETRQLHVGQVPDQDTGARAVPIYQTTAFVFDDFEHARQRFALQNPGNIYGRLTNPTQDVFERRMASLEGGVAALATASGAAALAYIFQALTRASDHIVFSNAIYGGTYNLLAHTLTHSGIGTDFVDPCDLEAVRKAIRHNTKCIFIETMGNPNATLTCIEDMAGIAHEAGIPLVVDSTFTPPSIFRPIEHGADIVVHSATKFIGGHGAALGGVIIDGGKFDWVQSGKFTAIADPNPSYYGVSFVEAAGEAAFVTYIRTVLLRDTGSTMAPLSAFLLLQGLETLSLRVERHIENALCVIGYLADHLKVDAVYHPSLPDDPGVNQHPNGATPSAP
jgi:O-acetylhomoserine (thiol)-lyase